METNDALKFDNWFRNFINDIAVDPQGFEKTLIQAQALDNAGIEDWKFRLKGFLFKRIPATIGGLWACLKFVIVPRNMKLFNSKEFNAFQRLVLDNGGTINRIDLKKFIYNKDNELFLISFIKTARAVKHIIRPEHKQWYRDYVKYFVEPVEAGLIKMGKL